MIYLKCIKLVTNNDFIRLINETSNEITSPKKNVPQEFVTPTTSEIEMLSQHNIKPRMMKN